MYNMNSLANSLQRCPQRFLILLIGGTGHGKSAIINHLLNTDTVKTGRFDPETKATVEYLVATGNSDSDPKLGIIDTPGFNNPDGIKQDACNLHSMKLFFKTHPLYSKPKCYPNLIFLVISANEHRIDGSGSKLAHILHVLKELDVVDQGHPNVVAVLTFCCSVSYCDVPKWKEIMQEKKDIISRNIYETFNVQAPVVLLENDKDSNSLEKSGDFTVLPNDEPQPKNLYDACQIVLRDNGDHIGLSTFNIGFAEHDRKKRYPDVDYEVKAKDSCKKPISKDEQDLLNILRGSSEDGKLSFNLILFDNVTFKSFVVAALPCASAFLPLIWHYE